jgi:ribosomal protein L3
MIDDSKLNEVVQNMEVDGKSAFVGAMPAGEVKLVGIATEPRTMDNGTKWYPVSFMAADGEHEVSLKGLLQAEGLQYSTRDLKERTKIWYGLLDKGENTQARKFGYNGKKEREITYRKEFKDFDGVTHAKGTKGTMKVHSFNSKLVG